MPLCEISGLAISKHRSIKKASLQHRYDIEKEKLQVEAIPLTLNHAPLSDPELIVIHYVRGDEMQIKARFLSLNRYERLDVWILSGNDISGAAARGFTRSLRREIPTWKIRLVLFPVNTSATYRVSTLPIIHERIALEDEIELDDAGNLYAPRIVESSGPQPLAGSDGGNTPEIKFNAEKVYLLLGGVGSLGARIALWMYEVRKLVLKVIRSDV